MPEAIRLSRPEILLILFISFTWTSIPPMFSQGLIDSLTTEIDWFPVVPGSLKEDDGCNRVDIEGSERFGEYPS